MSEDGNQLPAERPEDGSFPAETDAKPGGRPKGRKNVVTRLKNQLEQQIREAIDPRDVAKVWKTVVKQALEGSIASQKIVLDYALSKPREKDDKDKGASATYRFEVTYANPAQFGEPKPIQGETYDQEPESNE